MLVYNLYRLGLLAVCLLVGWLIGLPTLALLAIAVVVPAVLSWFLLRRQREAMAVAVEGAVARGQARFAAHAAREDAYVDELIRTTEAQAAQSGDGGTPPTTQGDQSAS